MPYIKKNKLDALLLAGTKLSNIAFNLKQNKEIREDYRKSMAECQKEWDKASRELTKK